jgi:hypothetical protein
LFFSFSMVSSVVLGQCGLVLPLMMIAMMIPDSGAFGYSAPVGYYTHTHAHTHTHTHRTHEQTNA